MIISKKINLLLLIIILICFFNLSKAQDTCDISKQLNQGIDAIFIRYYCNNYKTLCDGEKISFWANGKIHIKGSFKKGIPYDTLIIFDKNGEIQEWKYIDTSGTTWFYNKNGDVLYSSSSDGSNDSTIYDKNRKRFRSYYWTSPPVSLSKWIIDYDEDGKEISRYSEYEDSFSMLYRDIKKRIDIKAVKKYELYIYEENKIYLLDRKYYNKIPTRKSDIIEESIITYLINKDNKYFFYVPKKKKLHKVKLPQ